MDYVQEIPHAAVWLRKSGVYRQAKLFARGDTLFADQGSGFIRLHAGGATSLPASSWLDIDPGPDHTLAHGDLKAPELQPIKKRVRRAA